MASHKRMSLGGSAGSFSLANGAGAVGGGAGETGSTGDSGNVQVGESWRLPSIVLLNVIHIEGAFPQRPLFLSGVK